MKLIKKDDSPLKHFGISSDDGSRFITFSFYNPFSLHACLIDLSFEIDKIFPGFEFSFSFIFLHIFYRHNKPEAMKTFDEFEKNIKEGKMETYSLEDVLVEIYKEEYGNNNENDDNFK